MKHLVKKVITISLSYSKSLMFIGAFMLMNSLFAQNTGCEYSLVFSYIPGTEAVDGTNNELELKLPSDKWTPISGVQTSSGRGNGTGALSFLRFEGDIKQFTRNGFKTGRFYSVRFTNTSKFTITFSLGWDGSSSGSYTLAPGATRRSYDNSPWYKDGSNHPKFRIGGVQIKFSHAEKEKYGTYFSKYFDCKDTPDNVANNLLEEKEEKELKQDEAKIGSLPENSVENIEAKIREYRRLANKYPGKAFQNEINELEQKKSKKGHENKAKEISRLPENTIEEIDKKIQQYEDLNNSGSEISYDDKIDALRTKRKQLKGDDTSLTGTKEYKIVKTDFLTDSNSDKNTKSNNSYGSSGTNNTGSINQSASSNQNAKKYYESAIDNIGNGNLDKAIKDLRLQKEYTSDPTERAKIDANIKSVNSRQTYENDWAKVNEKIERDNYLNQQSLDFTNKVDAAANGNDLYAAVQKGGYAIGSALGGRFDVNSATGAAISLLNHLGEKKREREELEAKKRALKAKIAEEDRKREEERQKFLNGLKRERKLVLNNFPNYSYPNYLTNEAISKYYYFAVYTNQDILNTDYPEVDITDIIEVNKYKDGTWPFENDFKADLQKLSSKPIKYIVGFSNYESAAIKLGNSIKGFGKGGVKLLFLKASKNNSELQETVSSKNTETEKDFWGNSVKTKKNKSTKKVIKKDSVSKKEDFWGKTIKTKD